MRVISANAEATNIIGLLVARPLEAFNKDGYCAWPGGDDLDPQDGIDRWFGLRSILGLNHTRVLLQD